jgi:hypothetical protein
LAKEQEAAVSPVLNSPITCFSRRHERDCGMVGLLDGRRVLLPESNFPASNFDHADACSEAPLRQREQSLPWQM